MNQTKQLKEKNDPKLSRQEALVQSPGDSDGIAAPSESNPQSGKRKASPSSTARGMEVLGASSTENTADPATGREWYKRSH